MEIYNIILIWPAHEQSRDSICETQEQQKEVRRMKPRSEEHTSELQSPYDLVCRLLLEKKKPDSATTRITCYCSSPTSNRFPIYTRILSTSPTPNPAFSPSIVSPSSSLPAVCSAALKLA